MAFFAYQVVRAVSKDELAHADVIAKPDTIPYFGMGCTRSIKITSELVKAPWDENHKSMLQHKCEELWPLWFLANLMMQGFIRIDGRLVFQDKELYGSAWVLMFKLLGQWNKGICQSGLARAYILGNLGDVLKFAFISPEEAQDKQAFVSCTTPLNLSKPCNPLPPSSPVFCVLVYSCR
jgi:hypothetical protein